MTDAMVFGAQGQLGYQLVEDLKALGKDVIGLSRQEADITDRDQIDELMRTHRPGVIYNAAAYNAVDRAETERLSAMSINAHGPAILAASARKHQATMVHFSTDFVFGEGHDRPIDEGQTPSPLSAYGRSKYLGERLVLQNCPSAFVVRCCGLYGARRANFVRTMIKVALMGKPLTVVNDQIISPTWVAPLSKMAIALSETDIYGTYHAVSHGSCSWYAFAAKIFDCLSIEADLSPTGHKEWGAPAARPSYSALDNTLLQLMGLDQMTPWDEMLAAFLEKHGQMIIDEERAKLKA